MASRLCAATNAATNDELVLRPPYQELPATFWEQHSGATILGAVLVVVALGLLAWWLLRPRAGVTVPVEVQVRQELETLRQRPEDGQVLSQVSRAVRRYFAAIFELPAGEMTTTEFSRAAANNEKIGAELAANTTAFLRRCDELKFAPGAPTEIKATEQALKLLAEADAKRQESLATKSQQA
jgi:hypothetical protein